MPIFSVDRNKLSHAKLKEFKTEKELQSLIESNLETVFNCRFVATEFPTGPIHAGRIDTLALSEDNNPVIIEYKKVESSDLINQSLFYLSWLRDHRGDFEIITKKTLGSEIEIDWEDIRVICIAPGYKKYDLHAVQMMGANIELWQYKIYDNNILALDEVFRKQTAIGLAHVESNGKNPKMVEAGKKAALTRATGSYTIEEHINKTTEKVKPLLLEMQSYILEMDESIEEVPKKFYIAYKVAQNFVCIELRQNQLLLFLKLNPDEFTLANNMKDVRNIGHRGTGDLEIIIETTAQLEEAKKYIKLAYDSIGG
jgi:predicted transport protein